MTAWVYSNPLIKNWPIQFVPWYELVSVKNWISKTKRYSPSVLKYTVVIKALIYILQPVPHSWAAFLLNVLISSPFPWSSSALCALQSCSDGLQLSKCITVGAATLSHLACQIPQNEWAQPSLEVSQAVLTSFLYFQDPKHRGAKNPIFANGIRAHTITERGMNWLAVPNKRCIR